MNNLPRFGPPPVNSPRVRMRMGSASAVNSIAVGGSAPGPQPALRRSQIPVSQFSTPPQRTQPPRARVILPRAFFTQAAAASNGGRPPSPINPPPSNSSRNAHGRLNSTGIGEDNVFDDQEQAAIANQATSQQSAPALPVPIQRRNIVTPLQTTSSQPSHGQSPRTPPRQEEAGPSRQGVTSPTASSRLAKVQSGRIQKKPSPQRSTNKRKPNSPSRSSPNTHEGIPIATTAIPKTTFAHLVRFELQAIGNPTVQMIQNDAIVKLHRAAETFLQRIFHLTNLLALHAKRKTIKVEDWKLALEEIIPMQFLVDDEGVADDENNANQDMDAEAEESSEE